MDRLQFRRIQADKPIDIYEALVAARRLQLQPALARAVGEVGVTIIDGELRELVPAEALNHVAGLGLRGERVFPIPSVLEHAPPLIGYYRMLLGISKKEFQQTNKLGYGSVVGRRGARATMSPELVSALPRLCAAFIEPLVKVVYAMNTFDNRDLNDLALLTLGPTLQGGRNNVIGSRTSKAVFEALRAGRGGLDRFRQRTACTVRGSQWAYLCIDRRGATLMFASTKPSRMAKKFPLSRSRSRVAKMPPTRITGRGKRRSLTSRRGFPVTITRWTIMVTRGLNQERLRQETPSSTELFDASEVMKRSGPGWKALRERFVETIDEPLQ